MIDFNDESRRRYAVTLVGETETGKTTAAIQMIDSYTDGMVTIFDPNNENDLRKYSQIPLEQIAYQKKGVYRCVTIDHKAFTLECLKNYNRTTNSGKKGLIVYDDCTPYFSQQPDKDILQLMVGVRHASNDIITCFHQLWRIPPFVIDNSQIIVIFKTGESPEKGDIKRFRHGARIMEAFKRVEAHPDPHHYEIVITTGVGDIEEKKVINSEN